MLEKAKTTKEPKQTTSPELTRDRILAILKICDTINTMITEALEEERINSHEALLLRFYP